MRHVKDFIWKKGTSVKDLVEQIGDVGFQSDKLKKAAEVIIKMKKSGAKIFFTFTSNMVSSGLRGLFAQTIKYGIADMIVTTVGGIEEDIMKACGEKFVLGSYKADDYELHEKGINRIGNIMIRNESYMRFEDYMTKLLKKAYEQKPRWSTSELLHFIGLQLNDENSILYQCAKKNIPVFCPAITDGSFGFHLFLLQQKKPDFVIDTVADFGKILFSISQDDVKGLVCLGGGVSKHHAILAALLNGGLDYAVYISTARQYSGSMSGATTDEAKSWGKIKDDSDAVTVNGEATLVFPLVISYVLDKLAEEGIIQV